MIAGTAPT